MTTGPLDRAALLLGAVGVASPLFALSTSSNNNFVDVAGLTLVLLPVLGACAVVGAVLGRRRVVLGAGSAFVLAALVQLVQAGRSANWLDGDGSTFALLLGLGVGLLVVALTPRDVPAASEGSTSGGFG